MQSYPKVTITANSKTREQAIYEAMRQAIVRADWAPGAPLVVSRIAAETGVSRITVANALKRLAGEGFVQLNPYKEAVVTPLEPRDIREIYLIRAELEALSARVGAPLVTPKDFVELEQINAEIDRLRSEPTPDIRRIRAVDLDFHRRVRATAQMPRLAQTLENLADQCEGYRARLLDASRVAIPTPVRHQPLLDAFAARDGIVAGECMREHVLTGMAAVLALLAEPS